MAWRTLDYFYYLCNWFDIVLIFTSFVKIVYIHLHVNKSIFCHCNWRVKWFLILKYIASEKIIRTIHTMRTHAALLCHLEGRTFWFYEKKNLHNFSKLKYTSIHILDWIFFKSTHRTNWSVRVWIRQEYIQRRIQLNWINCMFN